MGRFHYAAILALSGSVACGPSGAAPEIQPIEDRVVAVGEELVLVINASDMDGDELSYSFSSDDTENIHDKASISRLPVGAGEFRWTPIAEDVGEHYFDFKVTDGEHTVTSTVKIDVRSAVGANSAPKFLRPQGMGTTLNLDSDDCFELDIEVQDSDSAEVDIAMEEPAVEGANLQKTGNLSAIWRWCPTEAQAAADDRYTLTLSADDHDNPKTMHPYLLVLRRAQKPDCPGGAPAIQHSPQDEETLVGLTIPATISDDQGLKQEPLLYYATTEPGEPPDLGQNGPFTQTTMLLIDGDMKSGTWAADVPNPVAGLEAGASRTLYYVVVAQDNDDAEGDCDHVSQSQVYQMTVTNPGGTGGAGLCEACTTDVQCGGESDLCVRVGTSSGSFCLSECSGESDCPTNYTCSPDPVESVDDTMARQCVPVSNDCANPAGDTCEDDQFENNDTPFQSTQKPLLSTGSIDAVSCPASSGIGDDEDWYEFELQTEATVTLQLSGGSASDLDLGLFTSPDATEIDYSEGIFTSSESVSACLEPGFYAARVYAWGPAENSYALTYDKVEGSCAATCDQDENEDDDNASQARVANAYPDPYTSTTQSICANDQDWYAVELFSDETVSVDLTFTHADGDLDVYLYDPDGTTNLTPCCDAQGQSATDDESLQYTVNASGTYYVVVEGYQGAENLYDILIEILLDV